MLLTGRPQVISFRLDSWNRLRQQRTTASISGRTRITDTPRVPCSSEAGMDSDQTHDSAYCVGHCMISSVLSKPYCSDIDHPSVLLLRTARPRGRSTSETPPTQQSNPARPPSRPSPPSSVNAFFSEQSSCCASLTMTLTRSRSERAEPFSRPAPPTS